MLLKNLITLIKTSLDKLAKNDKYLLVNDVHEQSISGKLACYLTQNLFLYTKQRWNVDVEYNRNGKMPKSLPNQGNVKPDIIIHRRGLNNDRGDENNNLLIIELKKSPNRVDKDKDIAKIEAFIREPPFHFKYGVFISIKPIKLYWFRRVKTPYNCEMVTVKPTSLRYAMTEPTNGCYISNGGRDKACLGMLFR